MTRDPVTRDPVTRDPVAGDPVAGAAAGPLTDWFTATLGAAPPLRFERLAGGYSNLTFLVSDAGGAQWVLRRPPLGHVLATAHDMDREGGIMAALAGTGTPVPASAAMMPPSRSMSCAVASTWPSGGRRSTHCSPAASLTRKVDRKSVV